MASNFSGFKFQSATVQIELSDGPVDVIVTAPTMDKVLHFATQDNGYESHHLVAEHAKLSDGSPVCTADEWKQAPSYEFKKVMKILNSYIDGTGAESAKQ